MTSAPAWQPRTQLSGDSLPPMAGVSPKTLSWLYEVLKREYRDPNRTYSDLAHALSRNPGLAPRTDVFTFENGASALLVHFKGTVPVTFRGTQYRFPIDLWVPHPYPYEAPIIYVTPTEDMMVRPGQHVGGDGKVYHPYLAHWRDAWERSNVVDMLAILSDVFAKEPPVISRTPHQPRQHQHQQPPPPQALPPPVPPLPREMQPPSSQYPPPVPHGQRQQQQQQQQQQPPPPPPKQQAQGNPNPAPLQQKPGRYDAPPPLPPQANSPGRPPSQQQQQQQQYGNGPAPPRPTSGTNYMPQRASSLRQSVPAHDHSQYRPQPARPGDLDYTQRPPPSQPGHPAQGSVPAQQYPPQQHYQQQPQYHQPPHPQTIVPYPPQRQQLHHQPPVQQHPPQPKPAPALNLLDSPFDLPLPTSAPTNLPAPPIPRNPEREALLSHLSHLITQSLYSQISQNESALPALSSQHVALQSTLSTLSNEMQSLQHLHSTLSSNLFLLRDSLAKSDSVIGDASSRAKAGDVPAVDDMLVPPTVVAKQLYDAVSEERGIEAAILALQEGFVKGRVGSEMWGKKTRELAREGFRRRWLIQKLGKGMGLEVAELAKPKEFPPVHMAAPTM